jgi:hypothetical protein
VQPRKRKKKKKDSPVKSREASVIVNLLHQRLHIIVSDGRHISLARQMGRCTLTPPRKVGAGLEIFTDESSAG